MKRPGRGPMRIALTADPELPVPPRHYGGIERIVDLLAHGLVERGHQVTLFAHPDSASAGTLVPWRGRTSGSARDALSNAATLARETARRRFDIVHSFSRIVYMAPILPFRVAKLMSYQRRITPRTVWLGHRLSRGTLGFTAVSHWMMRDTAAIGDWTMVPNAVPVERLQLRASVPPDAPLVFLGRIEEIKGPHLAIEIARRSGRPLVLAGNIPDEHRAWADANVLAQIDGEAVRYVGPVDDAQKDELLGRSAAFLMPILWDEPFGIVMAEAMACGTPVLGLARGAVPEVVVDGETGFVRESVDELVACVARLGEIDRSDCRLRVERLYSGTAMVSSYLDAYRKAVARVESAQGR